MGAVSSLVSQAFKMSQVLGKDVEPIDLDISIANRIMRRHQGMTSERLANTLGLIYRPASGQDSEARIEQIRTAEKAIQTSGL